MGFFDKIKKSVEDAIESATAMAKMDDFLIERIADVISESWEIVSERRPKTIAGISLEEEAEYNYTFRTGRGLVKVELEHEFPYVEIEMDLGGRKVERRIKVSDFVSKEGSNFRLKNESELRSILMDMMESILR